VKAANKQVDDGTGKGTTVRSCVKAGVKGANKQVDDGTGKGAKSLPYHVAGRSLPYHVASDVRRLDHSP
jgi:hypothetical protein